MCDTTNINYTVNNACTDGICCLNVEFLSSSSEVQVEMIYTICTQMCRRIHSTGTDPAMAQPQNDQCGFDEDILDYIWEELIEWHDNMF